jgi:enoyl-[acyl-carrier-protein] reductase (NADH)
MLGWLRIGVESDGSSRHARADIGGAVSALCADVAGWITGQTVIADGGASLMSPEVPLAFQQP